MPYIIRPMELDDIPEVMEIERQCYSMPWPAHAYRRELKDNKLSRYIVAEWVDSEEGVAEQRPPAPRKDRAAEVSQPKSLVRRALDNLFQNFARPQPASGLPTLAGYAGLWLMLDEAHVTTIAVRPVARGQGLGELLFVGLVDLALSLGAKYMTLEVRVSNTVAQNLYRKYGFHDEGIRKRYYSDDGEDALIMWSDPINVAAYQARLEALKGALNQKLAKVRPLRAVDASGSSAAM